MAVLADNNSRQYGYCNSNGPCTVHASPPVLRKGHIL